MTCPFNIIKAFTTWVDAKDRLWMVVNIDYWGLHQSKQENPQRVIMKRIGSNEEVNITAASFIEETDKGNMKQVEQAINHSFKAA